MRDSCAPIPITINPPSILVHFSSFLAFLLMGNYTVTDVLFGQNLFSILSSCKAHIRPVGFTVLYRYLLDKALNTTIKLFTVTCSCQGKTLENLVTDVHLVYFTWNCFYNYLRVRHTQLWHTLYKFWFTFSGIFLKPHWYQKCTVTFQSWTLYLLKRMLQVLKNHLLYCGLREYTIK